MKPLSLKDAFGALETIRTSAPQDLKLKQVVLDHPELSGIDAIDTAKAELRRFLKETGLTINDLEDARHHFATRTSAGCVEAESQNTKEPSTVDVVAALIAREPRFHHFGDRPLNAVRRAHQNLLPKTMDVTDLQKRMLLELCAALEIQPGQLGSLERHTMGGGKTFYAGERRVIEELIAIVEKMDSKALADVTR